MKAIFKSIWLLFFVFILFGCNREKSNLQEAVKEIEIAHFYPNAGPIGAIFTIEGINLKSGADLRVEFNGKKAEIISRGDKQVLVRVPEGDGTVPVMLLHGNIEMDLGTYTYQSLSVLDVQPKYAIKGKQVQIRGTGFVSGVEIPKVYLNDSLSKVIRVTDTLISVEVMDGRGFGPVKVVTGTKESTGPNFQYLRYLDMSPKSGGPGTVVEIKIDGLSFIKNAVQAYFKDPYWEYNQLPVSSFTDSSFFVQIDESVATGPTFIIDGASDSKLNGPDFTVVPAPKIFNISPNTAIVGTEVTINGSYFSPIPGETKVYIDTVLMPIKKITGDKITIQIHKPLKSGTVRVIVNGQSVNGPQFIYQNLGIQNLLPDNGVAGTEVIIEGFGFNNVPAANTVFFNGQAALVLEASANKLRVRAPVGVSTGPVQVQTGNLIANSEFPFRHAFSTTLGKGELNLSSNGGSIAVDKQGNIYVLEIEKQCIKKISVTGTVSHFAGSTFAESGLRDGKGTEVLFRLDEGACLVYDEVANTLALTEPQNQTYRQITLDAICTTWKSDRRLGNFVMFRSFIYKHGLPIINTYDNNNYTFNLILNPKTGYPRGGFNIENFKFSNEYSDIRFALDKEGNIYGQGLNFVFNKSVITKISNDGMDGTYYLGPLIPNFAGSSTQTGYKDGIGSAALFNDIKGITMLDDQNFVVLDAGNHALRQVNRDNGEVSTIFKNDPGFADGDLRAVKISSNVSDVAVSQDGRFCYILDNGNNCVRKIQIR